MLQHAIESIALEGPLQCIGMVTRVPPALNAREAVVSGLVQMAHRLEATVHYQEVDEVLATARQLWAALQSADSAAVRALGRWRKAALGGAVPCDKHDVGGPPGMEGRS